MRPRMFYIILAAVRGSLNRLQLGGNTHTCENGFYSMLFLLDTLMRFRCERGKETLRITNLKQNACIDHTSINRRAAGI